MADGNAKRRGDSDQPVADPDLKRISRLRMMNFKNFEDEALHVGPFTVIAGANASGKSNIRDAFRLLHGIGCGYPLADAIGGKYGPSGIEWREIRGAFNEIARFGNGGFSLEVLFGELSPIRLKQESAPIFYLNPSYGLTVEASDVEPTKFLVKRESLRSRSGGVYTSHPSANDPVRSQDDDNHLLIRMAKAESQRKYGSRVAVRPDQPALTQIVEHRNVLLVRRPPAAGPRSCAGSPASRSSSTAPSRPHGPRFPWLQPSSPSHPSAALLSAAEPTSTPPPCSASRCS